MDQVIQMVSVTDIKKHHRKVFTMLAQGPVMVANHQRPIAVVISPEQWNALVGEMDLLWAEREAALTELRLATGQSKVVAMSEQAITEWLAEEPTPQANHD